MVTSSAAQPRSYVFDAYNVGWSLSDKKRTAELLGEELVELWWPLLDDDDDDDDDAEDDDTDDDDDDDDDDVDDVDDHGYM